ncbi:leucine-rich repeat-containing protein 46 isoform X2 [Cyanistes caeruleus]|uniref:leucine-rich repeat-containing protein 46 isoform X2 n=1 Tax=Cyanistes caeruleus TaxID=156563 RepID=UPI000CDA0E14|nr:leucine-rich repeat-containing protein 46 isoform X2 [Cyanistes caeruleus]
MAEQGDSPCGAPEGTRPGVTLSNSLVTTRICPTGPLPTSTLRLDRENISCIGKLRRMAEIHSLYLQQNQIEKIENLESFPNLRFLCLAGNRIQRVENLQALPHLSALDLSHNQIRALDAEELPRSLRILDLTGNECSRQDGYRDLVVAALPHLLQLDSQPIHGDTAREEAGGGSCSSSSEEEEEEEEDEELFPELRIPFTVDKGARMGTGHAALLVWQCHISWNSRPGRFPAGCAPGAGGAGAVEAEEEPGGAPGPAGGAAGAPGSAAGPGAGPALSPRGTAVTSASIQGVPASSWRHPAPRQGSGEGAWCQRSGEWAVIPNTLQQQQGIKSLFPPQSSWMSPYSHPEGLEMGGSTQGAVGRAPNPIPHPCPSPCTSFQAVATPPG